METNWPLNDSAGVYFYRQRRPGSRTVFPDAAVNNGCATGSSLAGSAGVL
jgi:hypothetical protein